MPVFAGIYMQHSMEQEAQIFDRAAARASGVIAILVHNKKHMYSLYSYK